MGIFFWCFLNTNIFRNDGLPAGSVPESPPGGFKNALNLFDTVFTLEKLAAMVGT